ncbi:hypothetical protein D3C73_1469330 [compost metagenome]
MVAVAGADAVADIGGGVDADVVTDVVAEVVAEVVADIAGDEVIIVVAEHWRRHKAPAPSFSFTGPCCRL